MADSTLDSELFTLDASGWGVFPVANMSIPTGGFTASAHHNVATAAFALGTMIQVRLPGATGQEGFAQFIYLKVGTQNADSLIAAKSVVVRDSATKPFTVTNDPESCVKIPTRVGAIALSAMTDAYYGFFWCGGNCPESLVTALTGNYATDGAVAAGEITYDDLTADYIGFAPALGVATGGAVEPVCGEALAADA